MITQLLNVLCCAAAKFVPEMWCAHCAALQMPHSDTLTHDSNIYGMSMPPPMLNIQPRTEPHIRIHQCAPQYPICLWTSLLGTGRSVGTQSLCCSPGASNCVLKEKKEKK